MKAQIIAAVAHSINAAYCRAIGDDSQTTWDEAQEWQQQSAINGVNMHLANPDATPEDSHASWLAQKIEEGWVYGEEKDAEAKTHPCVLPYDELPESQKAKDYIFRETVHSVSAALDKAVAAAVQAAAAELAKAQSAPVVVTGPANQPTAGVLVKYIGRREQWKDAIYGTGLTFVAGQVRGLPKAVAAKLLHHSDLFEKVDAATSTDAPIADSGIQAPADDTEHLLQEGEKQTEDEDRQTLEFELIDQINQMTDKNTIAEFVMNKYQVKLNRTKSVAKLQAEAIHLVNQYGAE